MSNEKRLRLVQVAKEFKVGINTIADFLRKSGINSDGSPNSLVEPEVYAALEREYGSNRGDNNARNAIRERISNKQASVSIESDSTEKIESEPAELSVKSNVAQNRPSIAQPQVLGTIDLSAQSQRTRPLPKSKQKAAAEKKEVKPTPAPAPVVEKAPEVVAAPAPVEAPKPVVVEKAPVASEAPAAPTTPAADDNHRSNVQSIGIPQVLGTIDMSGFATSKGKHKRKRIGKEKVDINRVQGGAPKAGGQGKPAQGGAAGGNRPAGGAAAPNRNNNTPSGGANRPGANNQQQGPGRRNKAKGAKPVVRTEISDEEVSKQVKDTLARLTAKGAKNKGAKYRKDKRDAFA